MDWRGQDNRDPANERDRKRLPVQLGLFVFPVVAFIVLCASLLVFGDDSARSQCRDIVIHFEPRQQSRPIDCVALQAITNTREVR